MPGIEILQRGACGKRAADGMKGDALLDRMRRRLAFVRLRQFVPCMRQGVQLRRLLREQHHECEQQALQRARAWMKEDRHGAILVQAGATRYFMRHCFSPSMNRSSGSFLPMNTITLPRFSSGTQGLPMSPPMSMCTPWNTTRFSFWSSHSTPL